VLRRGPGGRREGAGSLGDQRWRCGMTAATERRQITRHGAALPAMMGSPGLKGDEIVKQGWLVMLEDSSGYLVEATEATGLLSAGIALQDCDATDKDDGEM